MNPRSLTYENEQRHLHVKNLDGQARRQKHTGKLFHLQQADPCLSADPGTAGGEGGSAPVEGPRFDLHQEGTDLKVHSEQG